LGKQAVVFTVHDNVAYMSGVIDSSLPLLLHNLLEDYPLVDTIVMEKVNGSIDLIATYEAGRILREACLTTVVPYDGFVASGGVSFFLAGCQRVVENKSRIAIHTWRTFSLDDENNKVVTASGIDLEVDDEIHQQHLDYLTEMGIDASFYWFAVDTPFEQEHYLSADELVEYGLITTEYQTWGAAYNASISLNQAADWQETRFYVYAGTVTIYGRIDKQAAGNLNRILDSYEIDTLRFGKVYGITEPHATYALELGRAVRSACLNTRLDDDSDIRGEAIHVFVAGCNRVASEGSNIHIASPYDPSKGRDYRSPYFQQSFMRQYQSYYREMGVDTQILSFQMSIPMYQPVQINTDKLLAFGVLDEITDTMP
jgi:hypothetical protein